MGQDPSTIRSEIEETRERMGDTVDALAYKADVKSRAQDSVREKVDRLRGATPDAGDVKGAARRGKGIAQENPLGLAIGAVAVGFIGGLLVPVSRVENEKIGPVADQVKEQAKETAQVAVEHGKEAAQEAAQAAKQAGQEHAQQAREEVGSSS
jgi:ElaB/YqjD/DUF883 family membrane-anchored ribosome-binding protein